jgi:hypothetical protein
MNHSFYDLERHVEATVERIAEDWAVCERIAPSPVSIAFHTARLRIGSLLITLGERIGGQAASGSPTPAAWPSDAPRFGF